MSAGGFGTVAVVGGGLIGGSAARRLHALGVDVVVVDPDAGTRAAVAAAGLAVARVVPAECGLVIVATPLDVLPVVLADVAARTRAVVVDVGSVKATAAAAAEAAGLVGRWVGCHPMAGTELSGFAHSSADLLVSVTWAVTRGAGPVETVVPWLVASFDATVVVLDTGAHDRAVALVSHAPHVLANALLEVVEAAGDPAAAQLAAGSFRDGTRVAGRDPLRSRNMLADNAAALGPVIDDLVGLLQAYRRELDDADLLADRLGRVSAGADVVRRPALAWVPCPDLAAALAGPGAMVVRAGADGLETARAHG